MKIKSDQEKTKEKIEVMQAYIAGKKIEVRYPDGTKWTLTDSPAWQWGSSDYRIVPEPRTIWLNEYNNGELGHGYYKSKKEAIENACIGFRQTIKFVEVIEDEEDK